MLKSITKKTATSVKYVVKNRVKNSVFFVVFLSSSYTLLKHMYMVCPSTSCCNELYLVRSCIDTHMTLTPMYSSVPFCLIGYCGYKAVATCSRSHILGPQALFFRFLLLASFKNFGLQDVQYNLSILHLKELLLSLNG